MKSIIVLVFIFQFSFSPMCKADLFGADVAVLAQILSNAIQQLAQLRSILDNGKDNLSLIRDINRGINDSLNLIRTISPNNDPGLYKDWEKVSDALTKLESIYGIAIDSKDSKVQKDTDQSIAEAVALNNSIYKYTKMIDEIGELIKNQSHSVSPGGAAKLTAQSLGVMLNLQNEMLRTQGTGLKLQAQALALQNRKDKAQTKQMVAGAENINSALSNVQPQFKLPRFE
ncbi:MAG: hypothetical protein A4S09_06530 [Proteobacteria bacterium SG_bin7]|nr:MAG: hypothetical protein A4S09_06530 [Proteobacteria bacterium SG_bin7]